MHRASFAQLLRHHGILGRLGAHQRQRTSSCHHAIGSIDVVFDQNRYAMQRPAKMFLFAFLVELLGDAERVGIYLDNAVDGRPMLIDGLDAREIFFGDGVRGEPAGSHAFLQFVHGNFVKLERLLLELCVSIAGESFGDAPSAGRGVSTAAEAPAKRLA